MEICRVCKEYEQHILRKNGSINSRCMKCQRAYSRAHYEANREKHNRRRIDNNNRYAQPIVDWIRKCKSEPCVDCKISFPYYVMDFDHLGDKEFTISGFARLKKSFDQVKAEIAKCEVVCANCHRERTHGRSRKQ